MEVIACNDNTGVTFIDGRRVVGQLVTEESASDTVADDSSEEDISVEEDSGTSALDFSPNEEASCHTLFSGMY